MPYQMTPRNKIIVILIFVVIIFTMLSETGVINMNYYKASSETKTQNDWINRNQTATIDSSTTETIAINTEFKELPVIVTYGSDTLYRDVVNTNNPVVVKIDTLEKGSLWTPLYKSSKFSVIGTAIYKNENTKAPSGKSSFVNTDIEGHLHINGRFSILGLCSHRQALKLIKELAVSSVVTETKRYFESLL